MLNFPIKDQSSYIVCALKQVHLDKQMFYGSRHAALMKLPFLKKRLEITMEVKVVKEQLTHQAILLPLSLKKVYNI